MRPVRMPLVIFALTVLSTLFATMGAASPAVSSPERKSGILRFTSGGHVLGFTSKDLLVAAGSHALRVEFVGAAGITPVADGPPAGAEGKVAPLSRVIYPNLWDGISLAYEAGHGGIFRSTYSLAAGADPHRIRLRYNAPASIEPDGSLSVAVAPGRMNESAPVAWQDRGGLRVAVTVSFHAVSDRVIGFTLGPYDKNLPVVIDPTLTWNTFLGSLSADYGEGIAVDGSGNIYVTGRSSGSWGTPTLPFTAFDDAFVAKLNSAGVLQWNTFLGPASDYAEGSGIAVDSDANVYIIGAAYASWGTPLQAFSGVYDTFVAKLDTSGSLQWHTFLGSYRNGRPAGDVYHGIAADGGGNIFVTGQSYATWGGSPVVPFSGSSDAFVAKLNTAGVLQWNTFLGSSNYDYGRGLALDGGGNIYITGLSAASWGTPVRAFSGAPDTFVAKLNASGVLQWNTFLGSSDWEQPGGIAVDSGGNAFVTGESFATWGDPARAFSGYVEVYAAMLNASGVLQWNTFLGSDGDDRGRSIAVAGSGNVYVTGSSDASWGTPERAFSGNLDAFVAALNAAGVVQWNAFLGSSDSDTGQGIALDGGGNISLVGRSLAPWGSPNIAFSGQPDAFVAAIPRSGASTDINLSAASVLENRAVNTTVGTFNTADPDGGTFTYALVAGEGSEDNASFAISGGSLLTAAVFDFEVKNSYSIRVRSTDPEGLAFEKPFAISVTDVAVPAATTLAIESLYMSGATLAGEVNPRGAATTAWFEWGTDPALATPTLTEAVDLGDGTAPVPVSLAFDGLDPGVTYYFRVAAQNGEGTAYGAIDYFAPEQDDGLMLVVNSADDLDPAPLGKMTLREAVARAVFGGVITFDQRLDGARIDLSIVGATDSILQGEVFTMVDRKWEFQGYQERNYGKSALYADRSLTIDASSLPSGVTLAWAGGDASHARVLAVYGDLTLNNVTVLNGHAAADPLPGNAAQPYTLARGGGIAVWGTATLVDCVLGGNRAEGDLSPSRDRGAFGGGIYADTVNLTGCVVSGNSVAGYGAAGGGIYSVGGAGSWQDSRLSRSAVTGNRVTGQHAYGGGVYSDGGGPGNLMVIEIGDCTIARNQVEDHPGLAESAMTQYYYRGGGFYMSNGILKLSSSTIVENAVSGVPAIFSGKPNMGGGGIAATVGDAHVVESMDLWHSVVAGNKLSGAPSDLFTGSLIDFYSSGYNLIGKIDFSPMLVPVPSWLCLSRRHYPKVGDQDGVAVGEVLDLDNIKLHDTIDSLGTDSGDKAVLWYPPRGIAVGRIPAADYSVAGVLAGYDPIDAESPVDDFPYLVLEKLRAYQGGVLGSTFGTGLGELAEVVWHPEAYTWPSDPLNAPWISFWRNVDSEIGDRLGSAGLGDEFWGSFEDGPFGENVTMTILQFENGPIPRSGVDQAGAARFGNEWGDVGAVQSAQVFFISGTSVVESQPAGTPVGTFVPRDSGETFTYELVSGAGGADNSWFAISGSSLLTAEPLDFEVKSTLTIRVRAAGSAGPAAEWVFTIAVSPINDPPTDILLSSNRMNEGAPPATTIGTLSTTDPDAGDTFTYSIVGGDSTMFSIDGSQLKTAQALDCAGESSCTVRIRSTDSGLSWTEKDFTVAIVPLPYVLWTRSDNGKAALWQVDPSLPTGPGQLKRSVLLYSDSGVGRPWQATSYTHVSATEGYVLWTRSDNGKAALWQVDPSLPTGPGQLKRSVLLYSDSGVGRPWQATSYTHVSATEGYVLWTRSDIGKAVLWQIDPSLPTGPSQLRRSVSLYSDSGVGSPWQATSYTHVSATEGYVLWSRSDIGKAVLWQIDPSLPTGPSQLQRSVSLYSDSGVGRPWQATSYTHVSATEGYVLWTRSDIGKAALWQIDPSLPAGPSQLKRSVSLYSDSGVGRPWQATSCFIPNGR